jgi:hypothetical protein
MALFNPKDLVSPLGALAALAGTAALGFAAGYALGRDPDAARRLMHLMARGVDRVQLAFAETREEVADLWADARESARTAIEEARFDRAEAATAAASAAAASAAAAPTAARATSRRRATTGGTRRTRKQAMH